MLTSLSSHAGILVHKLSITMSVNKLTSYQTQLRLEYHLLCSAVLDRSGWVIYVAWAVRGEVDVAEKGPLHRHWSVLVYQRIHSSRLVAGPAISCSAMSCESPPVM